MGLFCVSDASSDSGVEEDKALRKDRKVSVTSSLVLMLNSEIFSCL